MRTFYKLLKLISPDVGENNSNILIDYETMVTLNVLGGESLW